MAATGQAASKPAGGANDKISMTPSARARMRQREKDVYEYYDDMGPGKGHCTWGAGILAHRGPCTNEELGKKVSQADVDAEFSRRVARAENDVRRNLQSRALTQEQFDAMVSFTYNVGARGARHTFQLIEKGDFTRAAANINAMIMVKVNGKKVIARGLISRRHEESASFLPSKTTKK